MNIRKIKKAIKSQPTIEGAGVHLKRVFGFGKENEFDPFLLLDDFRSTERDLYTQGFPWHPHRGIETITYVLAGEVEHGDSMKNQGVIRAGDVQWMTAGSGIVHQEMPKGDANGNMFGFQLWANLPAKNKMMKPRYQEIKSDTIPVVNPKDGVSIKIIAGEIGGTKGPVKDIIIEPEYLDITLQPNVEYIHTIPQNHTAFAYVIDGKGYFCKEKKPFNYEAEGVNYFDMERMPYAENETLLLFFQDGDSILMYTEAVSVRLLLISGRPIKEPVAWYGPIVMNTREELEIAFQEYQNGTFIK